MAFPLNFVELREERRIKALNLFLFWRGFLLGFVAALVVFDALLNGFGVSRAFAESAARYGSSLIGR
jgi:hypothetical protein